ncbi:4-hydroxythreonine-4-phosphate dehydrogenase PdxA [Pseudemcibacter aquimaris]|uniref:4-hydroxythreonine-4-phosphate dehydrogenase PdxA n=1 Tax=Pseudemcibacter aquimaris TaxID=2857064 RepID=UPI00201380E9|nr:4-hydroxythreonine-4-phosphate dehydrogenase PdxA [Pseudemcibacter aquimaris]MCC3859961.1 4-hydroxythreonine-4-phosphate dehydrogenase PdxA [Pseudemcibacter aquimaris]WDU57293.1 4-hydroxythreonine-4-phosphate dehydrogenase PdxA [Pseudemcibacter aquimaris]
MEGQENRLPIAVTIGEPSGIGPEIIIKTWFKRREHNLPPFFVIGSPTSIQQHANQIKLPIPIEIIQSPSECYQVYNKALPVIDLELDGECQFAVPQASTAPMVIGAIDKAVDYIIMGQARAMVTAPIHKAALYAEGFNSPGHTEYLAERCTYHLQEEFHPVMMLASEELCVVPLTIHEPLHKVPELINHALLVRTIGIIHDSMKKYFGLKTPRIAVSGLNPHAGENNSMGTEDSQIILPAIQALQNKGLDIVGPLPADTMFHKAARDRYDVALCMYHDQALIPIKTIDFDAGVNVTLGLPIVRTSPDHGTALNIAGRNVANPTSIINSMKLADRMSKFLPQQEEY